MADHRTVKARFGYMPFMWVRVGLAHGEFALQMQAYDQATALMRTLYTDLCKAGIWYLRPDVLHLKGRALLGRGRRIWRRLALRSNKRGRQPQSWDRTGIPEVWSVWVRLPHAQTTSPATTIQQQEARAIVGEIARHIPIISLRDTFLGLPKVNTVLSLTTGGNGRKEVSQYYSARSR